MIDARRLLYRLITFFCLPILLIPAFASAQIVDEQGIVAEKAEIEKLGEGFSFTEGPAVDADGNVYFTDQPNNKIIKWNASNGEIAVFMSEAGRSNGMYFDKKGNLLACADMDNQLWSIDANGQHTVLVNDYKGKRLNGPNDLWVAPDGGIFFTDPLYKRPYWERDPEMEQDGEHVYYLSPNRKTLIRVDENLEKPNGIIGTPDGKQLYVADIGANKTYRYDIGKNGKLNNKTLFAELGSDGMTIDQDGNIYLTGRGVTVFNKKGEQVAHIPIKEPWTANVCFGGSDRKTLFITAMGAVYGLKMKATGVQ